MAKHFQHVDHVCARWQQRYAQRRLLLVRERRQIDWRRLQRKLGMLMRAETR